MSACIFENLDDTRDEGIVDVDSLELPDEYEDDNDLDMITEYEDDNDGIENDIMDISDEESEDSGECPEPCDECTVSCNTVTIDIPPILAGRIEDVQSMLTAIVSVYAANLESGASPFENDILDTIVDIDVPEDEL